MKKGYLENKQSNKKSALKYVWILVAFGFIFILIVLKFALSASNRIVYSGLPNSDEVYAVAKEFITPTIKEPHPSFPDSKYDFAKKDDSVYVIKSYVITKDSSGENLKTDFEITLKYKGGVNTKKSNWELLNLNEE